jgi:hypothetical protein
VSAVIKSKWELLGRRRCTIAFVSHIIWVGAFQAKLHQSRRVHATKGVA